MRSRPKKRLEDHSAFALSLTADASAVARPMLWDAPMTKAVLLIKCPIAVLPR